MAKNTKTQNKGTGKKATPKTPGKAPQVNKPETPAVEKHAEMTDDQALAQFNTNPAAVATGHTSGALSPDSKVRLLDLARRTFVEESRPYLQFPQQTQVTVNRIVAVGILCTMADHVVAGDDQFAAVMQQQGYNALVSAAKDLGFKLPDIKALPAAANGEVTLTAANVEVPEETKETLKKEQETRKGEAPELDPEKITSEEDLKKALEYMFAQRSNKLVDTLVNGVDFMKKFRLHEASLAENAEEAKAKFENYNSGNWLDDLFSYVKPSVFFTGIGRGMASVIAAEKDPIHAFCIFRDAIKDKQTNEPVIDDQEIAYCVKSIVKWVCNCNIESNKKAIDALDKKKNAKEIANCEASVKYYNEIIEYLTNPTTANIDVMIENMGSKFDAGGVLTQECQDANRMFNVICKTYYGKQLSTTDYKNIAINVQNYGGKIVNLFCDAGSKVVKYSDAVISDLEENSEEEKAAAVKEAMKARAKMKDANSKNA